MTDKLDLSRPVQVKNGLPARFLGTLAEHPYPHVFAISGLFVGEIVRQFNHYGEEVDTAQMHRIKLINVPAPKRQGEVWVDVIENSLGRFYARECLQPEHLGICVPKGHLHVARIGPIKWTEGEGLE